MTTKRFLSFSILLALLFQLSSCDWFVFDKEETDPEKTIGKVNNYWKASATGYSDMELTITENDNGDVVANIEYDGSNYQVEGKITDKGIYDYVYSNGDHSKPFTLVKFDAEVGDKWEYKVGDQTVVREVVKKSTEDDTPYAFWMIKTIDVEETIPQGVHIDGNLSQASKILWKFNHKFGFISATVTDFQNKTAVVNQSTTNAAD